MQVTVPLVNEIHRPSSSPADAYRADVQNAASLCDDDDAFLAIASLVHLAAPLPSATQRRRSLAQAVDQTVELIGREFVRDYARIEWRGQTVRISPLLVLAQEIQEVGGYQLAGVLLDDVMRAAAELQPLWRGRLLALRARIAWKRGDIEEARERYALIYSMGLRSREPELQARAEIGRAALAQLSGNLPGVYTHARRAVAFAERSRTLGVMRLAHQALTIGFVGKRDFERALAAAWRALALSKSHALLEAEALQNIGQIMLQTGHPAEARASFTAVLSKQHPDRVLLAALGGLALASAHVGAEPTVEWSIREIWRARSLPVPHYELANALLESANALQALGRTAEAERYRDAAEPIATVRQYHELAHNAEQIAREIASTKRFRRSESETIAEQVLALGGRLPKQVAFEASVR